MPSATDSAAHIGDFDTSIPTVGTTTVSQLDDFIRHVKTVAKTDFAAITGAVTASHTELNLLDGATLSTAELNLLDGVTATTAELNYIDGVTSAIQTQLDLKAPLASPTFTGVPAAPSAAAGTSTTQVATTAFVRTDGLGSLTLIKSSATGAGAAVDFIHGSGGVVIDSTYDLYVFELHAVKAGTDGTALLLRTTTDATNFDAVATDYQYGWTTSVVGTGQQNTNATAGQISMTNATGNASGEEGVYGWVRVHQPSAAAPCIVTWLLAYRDASGNLNNTVGGGLRVAAANVDGVRFLWTSGNFASGTINLYGRRK